MESTSAPVQTGNESPRVQIPFKDFLHQYVNAGGKAYNLMTMRAMHAMYEGYDDDGMMVFGS